ncbi:MAG: CinA family protein [Salinarchaeum sp.]
MSEETTTIEARVGDALRDREETVAVAESCTGGLIGSRITDIPGASDYFELGVVTYAYGSKLRELSVPREVLDDHGAVSKPTAQAMARGVRDRGGADWAIATTGVAGPTGGTPETPVGTVYIGIAHAGPWESGDSWATVEHHVFDGSRTDIKAKIATRALAALHEYVRAEN